MSTIPFLQLRDYTPEDYPMLCEWWKGHGWEAVPELMLPKLGVIVDEFDAYGFPKPIAASFLYMDNSCGVAMMEWTVSNPKAAGRTTLKAISTIIEFLSISAKEMNYAVILTTCKQQSLSRVFEKGKFIRTDSEMIHLIKPL